MSDYPTDEAIDAIWPWVLFPEHEGEHGTDPDICNPATARQVIHEAIAWARSNPAPQEPPIGADPAMSVGIVDDEDDDGWYSYDPGNSGYETHASAHEARETIREALEEYRNEALGDEWSLDAGFLHWGRVVPHGWTEEVTEGEHTDYVMREAAPQEPATLHPTSADKPPTTLEWWRANTTKRGPKQNPRNPSPTPEAP